MNKTFKYLLAGVLGAGVMSSSSVVFAADGTGNASSTIQTALTVTENTTMDFGTITVDTSAATVTMTSAGSVSGGTYTYSGSPAAGNFTASGDATTAVTISFTGGNLTGTGADMALSTFTHDAGGTPTTDGSGDLVFNVGADLAVGASQVADTYTGTYTVTVVY